MKKSNENGFSLVEVLVFISILGVFFVSAISVSIFTLRDIRISQQKVFASKHSQDMIEWLKSEKETSWNTFYGQVNSLKGFTDSTCLEFNEVDITWETATPCTAQINKNGIGFDRKVYFTVNSAVPNIKVKVDVIWADNRQDYHVPVDTVFVPWQ